MTKLRATSWTKNSWIPIQNPKGHHVGDPGLDHQNHLHLRMLASTGLTNYL